MANNSEHATDLRADDGTILEIKEGVVLDKDGSVLSNSRATGTEETPYRGYVRTWRAGRLWGLALALLLPFLLVGGFAVLSTVAAVILIVWILKGFVDLFIPRR